MDRVVRKNYAGRFCKWVLTSVFLLVFSTAACTLPELPALPIGGNSTTGETVEEGVIPGLQSIKIAAEPYTETLTDKFTAGIAINIYFYDAAGQVINFNKVPFTAEVSVLGYKNEAELLTNENPELLCREELSLDHSLAVTEWLQNKYIRIPYSEVKDIKEKHLIELGAVSVTVTTERQGSFSDIKQPVPLIPVEVTVTKLTE